jgi:hypothetical protein
MRVLILTHPRSGGMSLMNFIQKELDYNQYHEPFNNDEINTKIFVEDNIVVKDFPNHIINKGYDINDVVSKFDKVIIHHRGNYRDVAISLTYFQYGYGSNLHETYKVTDEWIKDNEKGIQEITVDTEQMFYFLQNTESNDCIRTTYDGIYNDKSDIPRLLKYLNIYNPIYLDILDKRHKLQNGDIGMEDVKVKPKLI